MTRDPNAPFKGWPIPLVVAGYVVLVFVVYWGIQWIGSW